METEKTITSNQQTNNFKFPQGYLKKEFTEQPNLLGQSDCVNQETNKFILPQDDLKNSYYVHYEEFDHIEVSIIEIFDKVSFKTKGKKAYPILLTDGKRYVCIYGQEYVESALATADHSIRCLVKHVDALSNQLLSVKATGLRIKSECDPVLYPEILVAFKTIFEGYEESGTYTDHVEHGGVRRGAAFQLLKEDDFIDKVLVDELGKFRQTILNYKSDANNITDDLFQYLIQEEAGKSFFEKIRKKKNESLRMIEENIAEENDSYDFTEMIENIICKNVKNAFLEHKNDHPISDFNLLLGDGIDYVQDSVKIILKEIDNEIQHEKERVVNIASDNEETEVKFLNFEPDNDDDTRNAENENLRTELKKIHEELGDLIKSEHSNNLKNDAMNILVKFSILLGNN